MTEEASPNLYESDKPGTAKQKSAELTIEELRSRGGVFVEAVRATRMAMVLTDPSLPGNPIVFANESFLALSGYEMDEVLGQQPYFLNGPATDPQNAARFRNALAEDHDETLQTIQYAKDGACMVVSLFLTALKDDDGRTVHHLLSWRDITRQIDAEDEADGLRKSEAALRQSEERQAFLLKLTDALRSLADPLEIQTVAMHVLGEHLHIDGAQYYESDDNGEHFSSFGGYTDGSVAKVERVRLDDFGPFTKEAYRAGRTLVVEDVWHDDRITPDQAAAYKAIGVCAYVGVPLIKAGRLVVALGAVHSAPKRWTKEEHIIIEETAQRTWAAVERARAEAALRESEARYRTLFEAIDSGFCIIEIIFGQDGRATDYRFVEANPSFERQSGLVDAVGRRIRELAPDLEEHWFERYGRVALTGEALHVEGEAAPLGRWFDIHAFRFGAPERHRVAVLFTDISDRRSAEAALRASEEQFSSVLNQAPLGVYLVDADFIIRQVNPVAMPVFGDIPGGPVGRDFDEIIHILWDKDYADEVVRIFRQTMETGVPYVTPERAEHRSDRDVVEYYEWRLDRIMLPAGSYGVVCYFRDISAQVHARQEIERANELARESEERLAIDLADTRVLQAAGAAMINDSSGDNGEQAILLAAVALMRSDCASIQMLDSATDQLILLGHIGFHPESARFWDRVTRGGGGTCSRAFNERRRIIIEDVREDEIVCHSEDLQSYQKSGIISVQTTPLVTRAGKLIGMMSTHWRERHRPDERQFGHFDVLARQAADLIEWRSTSAALRESEERLRLIVESARDYAIFTADQDDLIDEWLPGAQRVFGYSKEEAEGQPSAILFTPEDRQNRQPEKEVETARREGKAANVRWHLRKGGDRVFIEGQVVPLRNAAGEVQGFLKIGQDVTDRRLAEEALRDSEERFRQFGEASSDLLWIRNAETLAFEYLSPAFDHLYGVPREQILVGNDVKAWAELIHPDDREGALDMLRNLRGGLPGAYEFRVVRPDGSMSWLHDTNFPLRDDSGEVVRVAGIAQDITDRKLAVELQGTLLAELQHRVRNILALIQSVVRRTADTNGSAEEYALHLGGRIAAMARTQAMITRSPNRSIDLEDVLRDELLSIAASENQHWVEGPQVSLPPKAAEVFTLAIHELATNSLKYGALSDRPGQLEIRWDLEKRGEQVWLVFEWEETRVKHTGFSREGFGTELVTRRVPYELRGRGSIEPTNDGMIAKLEFPLVRSNSILETNMPEQLQ